MKNIFAKFQEYVNKPKRNVFDMSFRNNLTLKFGQLTPVFCKEVIPGDSFKINTAFGLQFMPMKFPVQTPMKAYIHFFYVRNRTIWKDWMDFIGGTKENLVPPYVTPVDKQKFFRVGGLADYLGVPNVMYGDYGRVMPSEVAFDNEISNMFFNVTIAGQSKVLRIETMRLSSFVKPSYATFSSQSMQWINDGVPAHMPAVTDLNLVGNNRGDFLTHDLEDYPETMAIANTSWSHSMFKASPLTLFATFENIRSGLRNLSFSFNYTTTYKGGNNLRANYAAQPFYIAGYDMNGTCTILTKVVPDSVSVEEIVGNSTQCKITQNIVIGDDYLPEYSSLARIDVFAYPLIDYAGTHTYTEQEPWDASIWSDQPKLIPGVSDVDSDGNLVIKSNLEYDSEGSGSQVIGVGTLSSTPYDSDIHLSALPFRAYEAIYNAYYRNPQNNPFVLNGVPEYNRYITTYEGGADSTQYDLYFRNWEYDFLTSSVQSPQQGIAPLVGMSVTGEATFADEEGNTYYAQAILNDEGEITGWQSHSSNMPVGSLRLLMDMAGTGISINDLRNVNAFQRFLENNIRHGLKYRDQLMSHFGVKARYDELDMPEFIGGVSTSVDVNKLSQTSNSGDTPLGSFVGQASALGQSKHDITHYCDEHGFIIGIMSVVPVPVYSQLLPKFFVKSTQLDYYFPEFGHIGYQPIQQLEVSPLQTYYAGDDLRAVFGYNRAWYDYLASTDEVHSQFRTTMRDFIMNRTFDSAPELSEDFLLVDPDQLNDVFLAGTDDDLYAPESDKIIGSLLFNVSAKRPIPLFGIPKIEA